ncbi:hypothetical protein A9179_19395 [Pseudomonas alcaligenes]|uniref:DUF805 domain-containing protein n=1 Tax=Aquipseudomonas alcaligenes TaxID=43263 RepID=A0ABR7S758_AQUAC|nr:DUF805 domain-containing protein [Pseudomonas alcaligenes]MBC9252436.1 hypothetical protein [Pseudomonas alcaligenes]
MTEARFKIVFSGELMPDMAADTVKDNLAQLFKSNRDKIEALFSGARVPLKRDLAEAEADKYLTALQRAGARVYKEPDLAANLSLVETDDHRSAAAEEPASDEHMSCPKCGHEQAKANECSACGIIIDKYLARQAQLAASAAEPAAATATAAGSTPSPYATPKAQVAEAQPEYAELKVFSIQGRIGRVRYLAWSAVMSLIFMAAYLIAALSLAISPVVGGLLITAVVIAAIVVGVQIGVQRLHDLDWSGWLWLLLLVPIANFVMAILMLVVPGTPQANRFGPPPPPNSTAVKVLAFVWLGLPVVAGILAALAVPAYQDYVERAQQAQHADVAAPVEE